MIDIRMNNELIRVEDEKTAKYVLRTQGVKMSQVSKDGEVWTVNKTYAPKPPKRLPPLDPDACRRAAGWE